MPKVSILMPIYNAEAHLEQAVESILNQTHNNLELICQDDGSKDSSLNILNTIAKYDSRVRVLTPFQVNRGVIAARNKLLSEVTGDFIAWMDSDDVSVLDRLKIQLDFLERHKDFVAVGTAILLTDDRLRVLREQRFDKDPNRQAVDPEICCATIMARTEAVVKAGPFREVFRPGGEDGDWLLKMSDFGLVTNIDNPLYLYRQHDSSTSRYFAPIRRLGVLSRMSARVRRVGKPDPVEDMKYDPTHYNLRDDIILADQHLSPTEKTLALSLPLKGGKPLISILVYFQNDHPHLVDGLRRIRIQDFKNYEILIFDDASDIELKAENVPTASLGLDLNVVRSEKQIGAVEGLRRLAQKAKGSFLVIQMADQMREDRLAQQLTWLLGHEEVDGVGSSINLINRDSHVTHSIFYESPVTTRAHFKGEPRSLMVRKKALRKSKSKVVKSASSEDHDSVVLTNLFVNTARLATVVDILYYRRESTKPKLQLESELPSCKDEQVSEPQPPSLNPVCMPVVQPIRIPYHDLYFRMRAAFLDFGLSVSDNYEPDDVEGLKAAIARYKPLLSFQLDTRLLGDPAAVIAWLEFRAGLRGFFGLIILWSQIPRSAFRLIGSRTKRLLSRIKVAMLAMLRNSYETVRQALTPILPRGAIMGRGVLWTRISRGKKKSDSAYIQGHENPTRQVVVYDAWGDLPDALDHLLPNGNRIWKDVKFIPAAEWKDEEKPDYALILNHVGARPIQIDLPPNRVWFAMGEPPTQTHSELNRGRGSHSTIISPVESPGESTPSKRTHVRGMSMTRTWSVKRTYNQLVLEPRPRKTKNLSWITSNLALLAGHRYRLAFLERIRDQLPLDLYGRGFSPIADKWDALASYKYTIAFENTVADHYITEKLFDGFVSGCLPFYYGAGNAEKYFPSESFVRIDPEDPNVAEKMLDVINSDLYESRKPYIEEARELVIKKYNMFIYIAEKIDEDRSVPMEVESQWFYPVDVVF